METKLIDHLFRHHSGKMVSVLTRIFGLTNLEIVEDAVQDTFIKASISWRQQQPEHPEAWLTQAAKHRVLDILRTIRVEKKHIPNFKCGIEAITIKDLFLDSEIEDAQLRMIFTACHPKLHAKDRIAFALKTVSGFNTKEIASALLTKEDTIKKRLSRARKAIQNNKLQFKIPQGKALPERLESVMEVLYLIFNEGFHSNRKEQLIRKDLCGEAMRLSQLLLKKECTRTPENYALFALFCFHSARLDSKINTENEILDLKTQDRSLWHTPLIELGNTIMTKAVKSDVFSCYHYEAAIAAEHLRAFNFNNTNWTKILHWYECLNNLQPMPTHLLTMAVVCIQNNDLEQAKNYLDALNPESFSQRAYLYYGTMCDYYAATKQLEKAIINIDLAIETVTNTQEHEYLQKKKTDLLFK